MRDYVLQPFRTEVRLQIDYAAELNEQQHAAVTAPPGPSLVIAGAGSGKTRTLIYRVAYLLEQGIPPERILLLTFTNKAAKEMMRRVADLLGQELASLWGGTFHSIGNRILRQHAKLLGYERDFTILDREDSRHLIATCMADAEIDVKATRFPKAEVLAEVFSMALNMRMGVQEIVEQQYDYFGELAPRIAEIAKRYIDRKRATNAMDFDDLLALWLRLMQENAEIREQYQRRFQFILVDEYQDTNKLQSELIDLLAARHHNVMVVGDDAQSIYAWRGANYQNILKFPERHPDAKVYKIETNYRSTPEILSVANAAIAANTQQFTKQLTPARKPGIKPIVVPCPDSSQQAAFVAQRALELREEGVELNNIAVLYRSHFHALELQLELVRRNIPFSITSGIRFFEQAHIKDVIGHVKLVANPRDEISFTFWGNIQHPTSNIQRSWKQLLPPTPGKPKTNKLWNVFTGETSNVQHPTSREAGNSQHPTTNIHPAERDKDQAPNSDATAVGGVEQLTSNIQETPKLQTSEKPRIAMELQKCAGIVPKKAAVGWAQFTATIAQLEAAGVREDAARMIKLVLEAGYEDYLKANYDNYRSRIDDLEQLASFARQFTDLHEFLSQLALLSNLEAEEEQPAKRDEEQLRLSTIHQAKGLEFDIVFIIMLCDGLFPSERSLETVDGEEEERRLMYVAITRARNELYLTYPLVRSSPSAEGDYIQRPSRFLEEIPKELLDEWNLRPYG